MPREQNYNGFDASQILDYLWLGSVEAAADLEELQKHNITHVLTVGNELTPKHPKVLEYKILYVDDSPQQNLFQYFQECKEYIESVKQKGTSVLVHCAAGISRSATIVCAYLMLTQQCDCNEAFYLVKRKRQFINPNSGFKFQLKLLERLGLRIPSLDELKTMLTRPEFAQSARDYFTLYNNQRILSQLDSYAKQHKLGRYNQHHSGPSRFLPARQSSTGNVNIEIPDKDISYESYVCKSCKFQLFSGKDEYQHDLYDMVPLFRVLGDRGASHRKCNYYSILNQPWTKIDSEEGELFCECGANVGFYNFNGDRCGCWTFVSPAIFISKESLEVQSKLTISCQDSKIGDC